jgi:hypothetical protein
MIRAFEAVGCDDLACKSAEATLHSVSDYRSTDFLRDGEADPHRGIGVLAVAHQQDESGSGRALAAVRSDEVRALLDRC